MIVFLKIKCDQYWPDDGVEYYGNIQVTHLHTISLAFYTKRIFTIKIKNSKKVIKLVPESLFNTQEFFINF